MVFLSKWGICRFHVNLPLLDGVTFVGNCQEPTRHMETIFTKGGVGHQMYFVEGWGILKQKVSECSGVLGRQHVIAFTGRLQCSSFDVCHVVPAETLPSSQEGISFLMPTCCFWFTSQW